MKRDMDLVRLILLKIEEEYISIPLINLSIDGYNMETVAYHCKIMHEVGLISSYNEKRYISGQMDFAVGPLTWEGCDYLDKVRDSSIWSKTKESLTQKGLPIIFETIKTVANAFITAAAEGIANSIIKNGGV